MKRLVNEIISYDEWEEGRGYIISGSVLSDQIFEMDDDWLTGVSNEAFFEELASNSGFLSTMEEPEEGKDYFYKVVFYPAENEHDNPFCNDEVPEPIATFAMWYSDMYREIMGV